MIEGKEWEPSMTEQEWLDCSDPQKMLEFLLGKASERKLRLFACACPKLIWERLGDVHRRVVAIGERYADNAATPEEVEEARRLALPDTYQGLWLTVVADIVRAMLPVFTHEFYLWVENHEGYCKIIRDLFGNPIRAVRLNPAWLTWQNGTIPKIGLGIYKERRFESMPILADALEEAGCTDAEILNHCRQAIEHVRGCWLLDLVLGKS
jgi:hypothetical protein